MKAEHEVEKESLRAQVTDREATISIRDRSITELGERRKCLISERDEILLQLESVAVNKATTDSQNIEDDVQRNEIAVHNELIDDLLKNVGREVEPFYKTIEMLSNEKANLELDLKHAKQVSDDWQLKYIGADVDRTMLQTTQKTSGAKLERAFKEKGEVVSSNAVLKSNLETADGRILSLKFNFRKLKTTARLRNRLGRRISASKSR